MPANDYFSNPKPQLCQNSFQLRLNLNADRISTNIYHYAHHILAYIFPYHHQGRYIFENYFCDKLQVICMFQVVLAVDRLVY